MTWLRMRNLDLGLSKHSRTGTEKSPSLDLLLPTTGGTDPFAAEQDDFGHTVQETLDADGV